MCVSTWRTVIAPLPWAPNSVVFQPASVFPSNSAFHSDFAACGFALGAASCGSADRLLTVKEAAHKLGCAPDTFLGTGEQTVDERRCSSLLSYP